VIVPCRPPPDARIAVDLRAGMPLRDLLRWYAATSCTAIAVDRRLVAVRTRTAVHAALHASRLTELLHDLLRELGLVVIQTGSLKFVVPLSPLGPTALPPPPHRLAFVPDRLEHHDASPAPVVEIRDGLFRVDRAALLPLTREPAPVLSGVTVRRALRDGRPVGYALVGIPADSLLHRAGLRQGDILETVAGSNLVQAVASGAFPELLLHRSRLELVLWRRGRRQVFTYVIE
jgi:hypothetical protein